MNGKSAFQCHLHTCIKLNSFFLFSIEYDILTEKDCHVPAFVYKGQKLYEESIPPFEEPFQDDYLTNDQATFEAAKAQMQM